MCSRRHFALTLAGLLLPLTALPLGGQQPGPIQDNSFLLEEAYNQEAGVIQHISFFQRDEGGGGGAWRYAFTQEWPFRGQRHQLSYTVLLERLGPETGLGDLGLNYRLQLVGSGETRLAVAPRLTLLVPTGSAASGLGAGSPGVQLNLPASWAVAPRIVTHWNAGVSHVPSARDPAGDRAGITGLSLGHSTIWLVSPTLNLMLEAVWTREETVSGAGATTAARSFVLSPGLRYAFNRPGGLQIVPGIAVPIGVGPSRGTTALVLYLSFEHPLRRGS